MRQLMVVLPSFRRSSICVLLLMGAGVAHAQTPEAESEAPEATPPSVIELAPIELPPGADPVDAVEVTVEIDAQGVGSVSECDASDAICELVGAAIEAGRFTAATRDGQPVASRVRVRLEVRVPHAETPEPETPEPETPQPETPRTGSEPGTQPQTSPTETASTDTEAVVVPPDDPGFGAQAVVERMTGQPLRLEVSELRELPGAFGDAYRAIDALPGVTPILSGVPYFYLRGSPPNGTLYIYDDVPVPALFHLALGPAVIHPRMVGPVRLYSGVAPARYGRLTGGVVLGEGPPEPTGELTGEVELRLLDVMGFLQVPTGKGTLTIAGRYGYPGLLLSVFSPDLSLAYWDYQARFDYPLSSRDRLQIVWFGSFDRFGSVQENFVDGELRRQKSTLDMQFHRAELRLIREVQDIEIGAALRFGFERSALNEPGTRDDLGIEATTLGPRWWIAYERPRLRTRFGLNMVVSAGHMNFGDSIGDGEGTSDPTDNPFVTRTPGRSVMGAYGEVNWDAHRMLTLEMGLRGDVWITAGETEPAADPRLRLVLRPRDGIETHIAFGTAHQPAVFAIPLPGLTEIPIDLGLQRSIQSEAGVAFDLPGDLRLEAQAFVHRYSQLFFTDPFLDADDNCPSSVPICERIRNDNRASGTTYGGELFVRRPPQHAISGFISYTLAKSLADPIAGVFHYTPSFDVRHVMNFVLQGRHHSGFSAGFRAHLRTGRPVGVLFRSDFAEPRFEQVTRRLPPFFRLDVQVGYGWSNRWGKMRVQLQWFNVTISKEPVDIDCELDVDEPYCDVDYAPALFLPNLGLRAEF